ncbi:MAG: DUF2884 family protein [Rhodanobacter sp.]|nr:MAG: DUF2884 family protein [Rhodanobacter sp.]TAM15148.1 MAG: DUF2884 family protein [Rhodanobacter sp.]TAM36382.1 MAG: DUF2884 family protein [Rhodanobacter sp.]
MRTPVLLTLLLPLALATPLHAQDLATTCHASSSYDVTIRPDSVLFDRPSPAPLRVELSHGSLQVDGAKVPLNAEDQDRLSLFERDLRALVPKVKVVADHGVDIAVQGLRDESAGLGLDAGTRAQMAQKLAAESTSLKQRIAASQSTHDWQGSMADQVIDQVAGDLLPLVAGALGQQAIDAATSGDLQAAGALRDRAADLATQLEPRMRQRMQQLRPQVLALCPTVRQLVSLQQGVRDNHGRTLDLIDLGQ